MPGRAINSTAASTKSRCNASDRSASRTVVARISLNRRRKSGPPRTTRKNHHTSSVRRVQSMKVRDGRPAKNLPQNVDRRFFFAVTCQPESRAKRLPEPPARLAGRSRVSKRTPNSPARALTNPACGRSTCRASPRASQLRHAAATGEDPPDDQDGGEECDELRQAETSHHYDRFQPRGPVHPSSLTRRSKSN
jgi:hypothetical protein